MDVEIEKTNEEQKKELHLFIDSSTNNLVKNLSNIFEALKFDNNNGGNVELNENIDSMANEINTLLNIVNKMKFRELKNQEQKEKNECHISNSQIAENLKKIAELDQNIGTSLLEMKKTFNRDKMSI